MIEVLRTSIFVKVIVKFSPGTIAPLADNAPLEVGRMTKLCPAAAPGGVITVVVAVSPMILPCGNTSVSSPNVQNLSETTPLLPGLIFIFLPLLIVMSRDKSIELPRPSLSELNEILPGTFSTPSSPNFQSLSPTVKLVVAPLNVPVGVGLLACGVPL